MMNINFSLLDEPIEISRATWLVLEQTEAFSALVKELYCYDEESDLKLFNKNYKALKESELLLVTDILGYNVNTPSILKMIYNDLEDQLNDKPEIKTKINQLTLSISDIMNHELLSHELDLEGSDITLLELFKMLGIKIETNSDTIFEKILEIIQIFKYLSKKKLLVFINICSYLTDSELIELNKYISLTQINILFVEPRRNETIKQFIIDQDFYLQYE